MRVLVIGCRGFIGGHLCRSCSEHGIEVVGASSSDGSGIDPESGLLPHGITIPETTDVVVYLAQSPYYRGKPDMAAHVMAVNVCSAIKAAELARAAGVRRFLYTSTGTVYRPSFAPLRETNPIRRNDWYALSKAQAEEALALFSKHMEIIIVRPFGIYGPGQTGRLVSNLVRSVRDGLPVEIQRNPVDAEDTDGLKISLCYIEDALEIYRALIMNGGPPCLNLAGERAVSIREVATALGELLDRDPSFRISPTAREGDWIADISLLRNKFSPRFTDLREGLRRMIAAGVN